MVSKSDSTARSRKVISFAAVSRLFKLSYSTSRKYCLDFYSRGIDSKSEIDSDMDKAVESKPYIYEQKHIDFICAESTLKSWVSRSIKERCILFHRQFPDKFIKAWRLRYIYKQNLIK